MRHIFNLNGILERMTTSKVAEATLYHKLISAFKGADVLTDAERVEVVKIIDDECTAAKAHFIKPEAVAEVKAAAPLKAPAKKKKAAKVAR